MTDEPPPISTTVGTTSRAVMNVVQRYHYQAWAFTGHYKAMVPSYTPHSPPDWLWTGEPARRTGSCVSLTWTSHRDDNIA